MGVLQSEAGLLSPLLPLPPLLLLSPLLPPLSLLLLLVEAKHVTTESLALAPSILSGSLATPACGGKRVRHRCGL